MDTVWEGLYLRLGDIASIKIERDYAIGRDLNKDSIAVVVETYAGAAYRKRLKVSIDSDTFKEEMIVAEEELIAIAEDLVARIQANEIWKREASR